MIKTRRKNSTAGYIQNTKVCALSLLTLFLLCFSTLALSSYDKNELLNKALEEDSPSAQYKLGLLYLDGGNDGSVNINKAIEWLSLSSEQGFAAASHRLSMLHFEGKHPSLSRQEALDLLNQAADKGHSKAQSDLASIKLNPPPLKKTVVKIKAPTKKKVPVAATKTKSVPTIKKTDTKLISDLAQGGDTNAQFSLATLLLLGEGTPKDSKAAAKWFKKAARQGHPDAMFALAEMYATDDKMKRYRNQAKRWYKKAADRGHTRARMRLTGCKDC